MDKVPVFLHIPKSAGTYVLSITDEMFIKYHNKDRFKHPNWFSALRRFQIINKTQRQVAMLLVYDPLNNRETNNKIKTHSVNIRTDVINIEDIDAILEDFEQNKYSLFSVIISPRGAELIPKNFFGKICKGSNKAPLYYTIFRRPYDRVQSLFNYIKSDKSSHEATHNAISANTFEGYLKSNQLEESWIIRSMCCVADGVPISEEDFNNACCILSQFKIKDISKVDDLVNEVYEECYGINRGILTDNIKINRNATRKHTNTSFDDMDRDLKRLFLERTKFDNRLYKYFIK